MYSFGPYVIRLSSRPKSKLYVTITKVIKGESFMNCYKVLNCSKALQVSLHYNKSALDINYIR